MPCFIILGRLALEFVVNSIRCVANATRCVANAMPFSALGLALLGFWAIFGLHHC